ncbi:methyltransferase [Amaricoccus sp.]|uniref:methyltransferase n=1 Tax=Amaricoccus sp. TaxID=1872485 RepID=UPI001B5A5BCD|nr:methyltransferase [Amaricoccus sp.]MBP7001559.1 methyltransferase [Amaricoccus sp.]
MSFPEAELTRDGFLGGRIRLWQPRAGYRAAIDPVLLAAFAPAAAGMRALDLGCGAGAAGLCLAARVGGLDLHGLERRPEYLELARRNAAENGLGFVGHEGDVLRPPAALTGTPFDLVVTNPPFHPPASAAAPDAGRDAANREAVDVGAWIAAGLRRLRPGGVLALVHLPARLPAILAALDGPAGAIEVLPLLPRAGRDASRVLVRAVKGRRTALALLAPLALHAGDAHDGDRDSYTPEAAAALRGESGLAQHTR